jgi:hypothetical protein
MKVLPKSASCSITGWLSPEDALTVLAINNSQTAGSKFLLWSRQQECVALFPAVDFEIIDGRLSKSWIASVDLNGYIYLAPPEWHGDFWDRYNDDEPAATKAFYQVMNKIESE